MKRKDKKLVTLLVALSCLLVVMIVLLFVLPDPDNPTSGDVFATGSDFSETGNDEQTNNEMHQQGQEQTWSTEPAVTETEGMAHLPWEETGAKQPEDYTQEEYEALTEEQKIHFLEYLGPYGLEAWLQKDQNQDQNQNQNQNQNQSQNQNQETGYPWSKPGAKQPQDYTLAEYHALPHAQKVAFVNHLGSNGYQKWLEKAQGQKTKYPWEKPGAQQPKDYTWEEYEALTETQKKAFREFLGTSGFEAWQKLVQREENPWEESGGKQPGDYTWEEFEALSDSQKTAFQEHLGADAFESWLQKVLQQENEYPWEETGAKQPKDYSWKEYKALTDTQQAAFQDHLGSEGLKTWLKKVANIPWDKAGAKQPANYTLKEFEALTEAQQFAFRTILGAEAFETWMLKAQNPKEEYPWDKPGAKQPADYIWKEYEALTAEQQIAFQNHLGSGRFEEWLNKVQNQPVTNPWDTPGAKQPEDYTWKEYESLTSEQQIAFQNHLGPERFETWMNKVQNQAIANPWDKPGAKQPADYTWEEFNALTGAQQMAFQDYLGAEGFEKWLNNVQDQTEANPWDKPGAKQPADYTWEEFNALTGEQQIAFQNYLGSEGFDAWLSQTEGS